MSTHSEKLRIVFLGTPDFAVPVLQKLTAHGYWPIAVVTAPDKLVGRKKIITPSPVRVAAESLGILVLMPSSLKDDELYHTFAELKPDLCVVVAYNKILPERYLNIPRLGFINIHPSLLPAYRGPSPVRTAILEGCTETGASIMLLDADMDHGPILAQRAWAIPPDADAWTCEHELMAIGADLLIESLPGFMSGTSSLSPQKHELATITHKFTRENGRLDWTRDATAIHNHVRALGDNPGTWTMLGGKTLNILGTRIACGVSGMAHQPGTLFLHEKKLAAACGKGAVEIMELQIEGSTRQTGRDFLNGHASLIGTSLI